MQFICIRAQCAPLLFKLASPSRCSSYSVSLGSCCCHATTQNQFKVSLCPFSWSWSIFNVKHRSAVWRAQYLPAPGAGDARLQSLQFQPGRIWINKHKLWGISYRIRPPWRKIFLLLYAHDLHWIKYVYLYSLQLFSYFFLLYSFVSNL